MSVIFPPRPKGRIFPKDLDLYEKTGLWLSQYKYNGVRNLIHIAPNSVVRVWGRHGSSHKAYSLQPKVSEEILNLPGLQKGYEYWLDSEILTKTSALDTKEKIVLFDVLHVGEYLFNKDQVSRLDMLDNICGKPRELDPWRGVAYMVSSNILMAPTFSEKFTFHFQEKQAYDEIEGLVLRKKNSVLDNFGQKEYEVSWLIRCRKAHKNYNF